MKIHSVSSYWNSETGLQKTGFDLPECRLKILHSCLAPIWFSIHPLFFFH